MLGAALIIAGTACIIGQHVRERGWVRATPTAAYIALLPWLDSGVTFAELAARVDDGSLRQWEYRVLVRRCIGLLQDQERAPQRLGELARMLGDIERGGRDETARYLWRSWARVSEIDRDGALHALVGLLEHDDRTVRIAALEAIRHFGEDAPPRSIAR